MAEEKQELVKEPFNSQERTELSKKYQEFIGAPPEEVKDNVTAAPEEAKTEEAKAEPEKTAAEPEKAEAQEKTKEEKTVPYGALHEERLKRQAEQKLRKEAEARAKAIEDELARLRSKDTITPDVDKYEITDYEQELKARIRAEAELKNKVSAIESVLAREQEERKVSTQKAALDQFNKAMSEIDSELKEEGVVGFAYMREAVAGEIKNLLMEDEANQVLDNKEGWKKIYKEKFYPRLREEMLEAEKKVKVSEKTELKKGASLGTIPGKAPAKPKSADELSPDEMRQKYFAERRARGASY